MELGDVLEAMDAPEALVRHVRELSLDLGEAWERCHRPEHRIWLAAVAGAPIEVLVEASAAAVLVLLERLGDPSETLAEAVELAAAGAGADELARAAERCEAIAERGASGYRDSLERKFEGAARAAAFVARAGEGLAQGEARSEADRLDKARHTAAMLGAAVHVVLPPPGEPARLNVFTLEQDPAQGAFLYAVAACAEAVARVAELPDALAPEALDDIVRSALEENDS